MNDKENIVRLDPRLASAASFVRKNASVADIGTDHAYLPIYLLQSGIAKSAVAADINRGPLERAKADAARYSMGSELSFCLSDGLRGIDLEGEKITDIIICGMGGELIARIVGESEYTKKPGVRLILQPMTAADDLRAFLDEAGYAVIDEKLSAAAGKIYCCIAAEYDGICRTSTPAELLLGKKNIENREPLFREYAAGILKKLNTRINGLKTGGHDCSAEEECRAEIEKITEDLT